MNNAAGIVLSKEKQKQIEEEYGSVSAQTVAEAVSDGKLLFGYTTPDTSSTGLNYLMCALYGFDARDPLSQESLEKFRNFQQNIPFVANTTVQMKRAAMQGSLDGFVYESQVWENSPELKSGYVFTPFGARHDNPVYSVGTLSDLEKKVAELFLSFLKSPEQKKASEKCGFWQYDAYKPEYDAFTGEQLLAAQKAWKENKDVGKEIVAVFVTDVSGSMDGEPLNALKASLINGMRYISDKHSVGLVSYSDSVTVCCPIAKFDLNQKALFKGAVESLASGGGTATIDGMIVGMDMILKELENKPDARPMLFVLSDGENNTGYGLKDVESLIAKSGIPVYTIGYNADVSLLDKLSGINEAATINATSDDVIYKLKNLFNANL